MIIKLLLCLFLIICAVFTSLRRKTKTTRENFITSDEIEQNTKKLSAATNQYNDIRKEYDRLTSIFNDMENQIKLGNAENAKNLADPKETDIAFSEEDNIKKQKEIDKNGSCLSDIEKVKGNYETKKKDYVKIKKTYDELRNEYDSIINEIDNTKENIETLKNKMKTCKEKKIIIN
jgi:predicted  nucleic acid-binding Zn-ribbon protein